GLASGCFQSRVSGTISGPITLGTGTSASVVSPSSSTTPPTSTAAPTTSSASSTTAPATTTSSAPTVTGDATAGKAVFTGGGGCGACHTLKDAGTSGQVGPDLDMCAKQSTANATCPVEPFTQANIEKQIAHPVKAMPPGTASGQDAINVAAYV